MPKKSDNLILIADDETSITESLSDLLELEGYKTVCANKGQEALKIIDEKSPNLILVDLMMPGHSGLEILADIKKRELPIEVIIITGHGTINTAVEAMKSGAYDYLTKPVQPDRIRSIVPKALDRQELIVKNLELERTIKDLTRFEDMIGQDDKMRQVYQLIDAVADTTANVFITGESGTGKELVARALHNKSSRAKGPFIAVNCSALPVDILENELFGHEKGAFTGALNAKPGCFEMADGGTLFLDEIGEMAANIQSKLLRALEEKSFRRLGGTQEIQVDVRLIAATNREIQKALSEGTLRKDLYFRLSVMDIELPPLRERMSDLMPLLDEFLETYNRKNKKKVKGFSKECLELFRKYHWPGNVRELKNLVERAVILCEGDNIALHHLPKQVFHKEFRDGSENNAAGQPLHAAEKKLILDTLKMTNNNKTNAAQILEISLKTLHNKLNKYYTEDSD